MTEKKPTAPALPTGIVPADLVRPGWKLRKNSPQRQARAVDSDGPWVGAPLEFELWHTAGFGWCIPTLLIRNPGRSYRATPVAARTYGWSTTSPSVAEDLEQAPANSRRIRPAPSLLALGTCLPRPDDPFKSLDKPGRVADSWSNCKPARRFAFPPA